MAASTLAWPLTPAAATDTVAARVGQRGTRERLVVQVSADLAAFCDRQFPRLVGSLTLYCGDPHVAEELAQEAIIKTIGSWSKVSQMAAPGAWLHRVAINLANSHYRRRQAESRANARARARDVSGGVHFDHDTPDTLAIREAVARLPVRQRTVLVLRYCSDLSGAEGADAMGITPGSVKVQASRALAALRRDFDVALPDELEEVADVT